MINRQHGIGGPDVLDGSHRRRMDTSATCIWCGGRLDDTEDAASFLFLAKADGTFGTVPRWPAVSPGLAGQQFFCHAACFVRSVPEAQQPALSAALEP